MDLLSPLFASLVDGMTAIGPSELCQCATRWLGHGMSDGASGALQLTSPQTIVGASVGFVDAAMTLGVHAATHVVEGVVGGVTATIADWTHSVGVVAQHAAAQLPAAHPPASGDAAAAVTSAGGEHLAAHTPTGATPPEDGALGWLTPYLKYGPWAILIIFILSGVGLHLSEDLILIPAGMLIAHGEHLNVWETLIAAYAGLVIGDVLWIAMCRRFGTKMVQSRWFKRIVHPRRLLEAKHQMELRGIIVVILARFIPGTRTPVITMAGILHMPWWKLLLVESSTCLITVPLQLGLGYLAGKGLGESKSTGELIVKLVAATAAFILIGFVIHWWFQLRKRAGRAPRSKASWLRTFGRRRREQTPPAGGKTGLAS